jgi:uncharacterized ferritin-like protein (DUF455 family)
VSHIWHNTGAFFGAEQCVNIKGNGESGLFERAGCCLNLKDPSAKLVATHEVATAFHNGELRIDDETPIAPIGIPGRPEKPKLVAPKHLPHRGLGTIEGRAALVHAVAHIEFNAINLAWDAVYRFRGMPVDYYRDWIAVADDEARHFTLLRERLAQLGHQYGDFDAHDGLWEMAVKTANSCLERMALVPRVLEARGLDVTPGMIDRFRHAGDQATVEILEVILREEVAHVAAGSRWFSWCCGQAGVDASETFDALVMRHARGAVRGPFNTAARIAAGFSEAELRRLGAAA